MNKIDLCRNILPFLEVTELAAVSAFRTVGKGNPVLSDFDAVSAMRHSLNKIDFNATVVIGEGERDEAPMLYNGEILGISQGIECDSFDIAVDPLECTNACAFGLEGAMSIIGISKKGTLLSAPDVYMSKIAVGSSLNNGVVDLDNSIEENIENIAYQKRCGFGEVNVVLLNRERNNALIHAAMKMGAKVTLIEDGDIVGAVSTCMDNSSVDMYAGIGGAPEGVLAAMAIRVLGGDMQGRLVYRNDYEKERIQRICENELDHKYGIQEMVRSDDFLLLATGVTGNVMCPKIEIKGDKMILYSIVLSGADKVVYRIQKETFIQN